MHIQLAPILTLILALWFVGLGLSFIVQSQRAYLRWTQRQLQWIWRRWWQLIVGIAVGYLLAVT